MYSILISVGSGVVVTILFGYLFGRPNISVGAGIVPGIIVMIGVWITVGRKIGKKLEALMLRFQDEVQPKGMQKPDPQRIERAIEILKSGYQYRKWNLLVGPQLDGQIGMAYYVDKKFDKAEPYLQTAMGRHWIAKSMLAVLHFKRKQYDEMKAIFDKTVKKAKKEGFLWNLYAYCLWKAGDRDGAIDVLSRGLEVLSDDQRLEGNRLALQRKKKMKMRGWNEMWYQFHLDKPPQPKMQIDRKQMYRGR